MKKNLSPGVIAAVIAVVLIVAIVLGMRTINGTGNTAVGVGKDGKPMSSEDGQAMMRKMRGTDASRK
jgi:hypothetical protein